MSSFIKIVSLSICAFTALPLLAHAQPVSGINAKEIVQALKNLDAPVRDALFAAGNAVTRATSTQRAAGVVEHTIEVQRCNAGRCFGGKIIRINQTRVNSPDTYPPFAYSVGELRDAPAPRPR